MTAPTTNSTWKCVVCRQPECAGLVLPTPLLRSHSYPAFGSEPFGAWPFGFLLSAFPTQPAHGLPLALPPPLPFFDGVPSRVEHDDPRGHCLLAPLEFLSA